MAVSGPAFLEWEPWWGGALNALALLALIAAPFALASFASVRSDTVWNRVGDRAPPVRLAVPVDQRPVGIVRLGALAWRRVPEDEKERVLTLRWFVCGPLVARGGSGAEWWQSEPVEETDVALVLRPPREDADWD